MIRSVVRIPLPVLLRCAAWGCLATLAVLSLLPGDDLVRTDLVRLGYGKQAEHFIAWFGATTIIGMAYQARLTRLVLAALLVPYAGLLEITQVYSPGRDASVLDFTASSAGIAAAVLLLPLAWRAMTWMFAAAPAGVSRGGQPPL